MCISLGLRIGAGNFGDAIQNIYQQTPRLAVSSEMQANKSDWRSFLKRSLCHLTELRLHACTRKEDFSDAKCSSIRSSHPSAVSSAHRSEDRREQVKYCVPEIRAQEDPLAAIRSWSTLKLSPDGRFESEKRGGSRRKRGVAPDSDELGYVSPDFRLAIRRTQTSASACSSKNYGLRPRESSGSIAENVAIQDQTPSTLSSIAAMS